MNRPSRLSTFIPSPKKMNVPNVEPYLLIIICSAVIFLIVSIVLWRRKRLTALDKKLESNFSQNQDPIEEELQSLERQAHTLLGEGHFRDSEKVALVGYRRVCTIHGADFWRAAVMLNRAACAQISQGLYTRADRALNAAKAILSEWPGYADVELGYIDHNLRICQDYLGY